MKRLVLGFLSAVLLVAGTILPATAQSHAAPARPTVVRHGRIDVSATRQAPRAHLDRAHLHKDRSMQLLRLSRRLPTLSRSQQVAARSLLSRPRLDRRVCSRKLCVHYSPTGTNRATRAWALRTLDVMMKTWHTEVHTLGYPRPLRDGTRGGDRRFDVYLKQIGDQGYYGYCAPEGRAKRHMRAFCVLDNDFSRAEFGTRPIKALRVTAAHEFFHAIQFAINAQSDSWFMESTAVWMEDQVADGVNDYLQYVPFGQLGRPGVPLDTTDQMGTYYGNFAFWTWLSERYGRAIVRATWDYAETTWSIPAIRQALAPRGGFAQNFGEYAASLAKPQEYYSEGTSYGKGQLVANSELPDGQTWAQKGAATLLHLTSASIKFHQKTGEVWHQVSLTVDGPDPASAPAATVAVFYADGHHDVVPLTFDPVTHQAAWTQDFTLTPVKNVIITLANASQRYTCWKQSGYACDGIPQDDQSQFANLQVSAS